MNTRIVNRVARTGEKVRYTELFDENGKIQPSLIPQGYDNIEKGYLHEGVFYAKFEGGVYSEPYTPQEEVLYVDRADGHKYLWNGTAYEDYNADIYEALECKQDILPYLSLERLRPYLYRVTFDRLPQDNGSNIPISGGCSAYVANGKLYRNYDFKYDNSASFIVRTKDFEGTAMITGLNDGYISNELIAQLPYRMVDGMNNNGIKMSVHILFNDWQWDGCGNKSIPLTSLPYEILSRVKSMATISTDLADVLGNLALNTAMGGYLLQVLVTDGTTTYAVIPPASASQPYAVVNATSNPKMTNFRWVADSQVERVNLQNRPTGVERFNAMPCDLKDLRFTKAYELADRLSEFIGINGTTKDSTDAELEAIYAEARAEYLQRERDGKTWQTMHSVVYGEKMLEFYIQENWEDNIISGASVDLTHYRTKEEQDVIDATKATKTELESEEQARGEADVALATAIENKVNKVTGKGLSTNDYTDTDKSKVASALQTSDIVDNLESEASDKPISARAVNVDVVNYVDGSISDTLAYVDQQDNSEHAGRVAGDEILENKKANKDGYYQALSAGYADKAGDLDIQSSTMVRHTQTKAYETTGGDKDVKDGAGFIRVIRGTENGITAAGAKIISLGFNLIPSGNGTTFTFRCVKGEWGVYGTSQKNNGYLFADSQGNILIPTSVKQNGVAVPTHTDHGNTYYLPSQDGQCTVVFATSQTNPCAHTCWSNGRDTKDNYEAYNASQVDLASAINAIGGTLRRVGYVFDEINLETKQSIRRLGYRLLNALTWTMEAGPTPEEGEATNTFRAIVSGGVATADTIKAGGAFAIKGVSGLTFSLDGTSLVCDSTIASVADFVTALGSGTVEYELAVEVVVANTLNGEITISDYGICIFENTAGATTVDIDFDFDTKWRDFIKNLPNDLEQMQNATGSLNNNIEAIAEDVRSLGDVATLPLLCGQPPVLFGAGAPAEAVVPDNWKQFDPATGEGYNWNGNPSAIGQRYINVSASNGGYTAGRKSLDKASADYYVLKWYKD